MIQWKLLKWILFWILALPIVFMVNYLRQSWTTKLAVYTKQVQK